MGQALQIVVCAGIVPDPLQTLEPVAGPNGPGLKNEMVLPAVLDPWAACALYEAAQLAAKNPGSKLWLVSLGPKAKLQQVMMTVGQKAAFELVPIDGPIGGFPDAHSTAAALAEAIATLPGLDRNRLLLFGGWESATRGAGVTLQFIGERLGITDQFQGVDQITLGDDGSFEVLERVEGGRHQVRCARARPPFWDGRREIYPTAQQSADRHGEYARHPTCVAEGQTRRACGQRPELRLRQPAQTAARDAR